MLIYFLFCLGKLFRKNFFIFFERAVIISPQSNNQIRSAKLFFIIIVQWKTIMIFYMRFYLLIGIIMKTKFLISLRNIEVYYRKLQISFYYLYVFNQLIQNTNLHNFNHNTYMKFIWFFCFFFCFCNFSVILVLNALKKLFTLILSSY